MARPTGPHNRLECFKCRLKFQTWRDLYAHYNARHLTRAELYPSEPIRRGRPKKKVRKISAKLRMEIYQALDELKAAILRS